MTFDLRRRHVILARLFASRLTVLLIIAALIASVVSWSAWYFSKSESSFLLGIALIAASTWGFFVLLFTYGATYFSSRSGLLSFRAAEVLHASPDLSQLIACHEGQLLLSRLEVDPEAVTALLEAHVLPTLTRDGLLADALKIAGSMQQNEISVFHLLAVLLLHPSLTNRIRQLEYIEQDLLFVIWWQIAAEHQRQARAAWWTREQLLDFTGLGLSWASGYTPFVDQFSRIPPGNPWDVPLGHEDQVEALINALARERQSNVLLVGQPGSGRLGVVKEVARRVNANQAHQVLNGQRLLYIHVGQLLGLAGSNPEQISIVAQALNEMERAGNVIAILDGVSSLLGGEEGSAANLTDVIMPFFSSNTVRVVMIMSSDEYHARFRNNPDLLQLFAVVQVDPLTPEQTMQLLALTAEAWEARTNIFLPYKTLRAVVRSTSTIMPEIPFPEKAFDVLEEALVVIQKGNGQVLTEAQVSDIISRKIGFNIGKLAASEKTHLLNLEDYIHARVVNQEAGVAAVARAMIRARAGVSSGKRPIGTFLFLGPTGVGKTETAKALAEAYFGSEDYLQRLDMSEFQGPDAIGRLIGTPRNPTGVLTSMIADHPFTVLLLDEFEKADRNVHLLFLQVFDEGHITDIRRRRFSFNHAIIVATSNAGAEFIRQNVSDAGTLPDNFDEDLREHILTKDLFRPELVNRFDGVITFTPLSREHIKKVAELMLRKLNKQLDQKHGLKVAVTPDLIDFLISIGYHPEFGARPMQRAIQNTVEYAVAEKILRGEAEAGQEILLHSSELSKIQIPG